MRRGVQRCRRRGTRWSRQDKSVPLRPARGEPSKALDFKGGGGNSQGCGAGWIRYNPSSWPLLRENNPALGTVRSAWLNSRKKSDARTAARLPGARPTTHLTHAAFVWYSPGLEKKPAGVTYGEGEMGNERRGFFHDKYLAGCTAVVPGVSGWPDGLPAPRPRTKTIFVLYRYSVFRWRFMGRRQNRRQAFSPTSKNGWTLFNLTAAAK